MAGKRHRSTKEEVLNKKLQKNAETRKQLQEKINILDAANAELRQQLKNLTDSKKKSERAAEAKVKREEKKKQEKELMKAIKKTGLSVDDILEKLND
ncbi:MAG: hypothetical protein K6E91_00085 [Butyrivibrio sp.]|nr:hypothetical protein [Butyrivibrio sp.]